MADATESDGAALRSLGSFEIEDGETSVGQTGCKTLLDELAEEVAKSSGLKCKVCGVNPRMQSQVYCSAPCGGHVRAAGRDVKRQGAAAAKAWYALRKSHPDEWVASVHSYMAKCKSLGIGVQRASFDWVRYYVAIKYSSKLMKGTRKLWLTKFAYAKWKQDNEGWTQQQGFADFEVRVSFWVVSDCVSYCSLLKTGATQPA